MKQFIRVLAYIVTVLSVLASLLYIVMLMMTNFGTFAFEVGPNVVYKDWYFIAVPILALLSGILLQIASLKKSCNKKVHKAK